LPHQIQAILLAQVRTLRNFYMKASVGSTLLTMLMTVLWYGAWAIAGGAAAWALGGGLEKGLLHRAVPNALLFVMFFWQFFPLVMASTGALLDIRRILVYPIPPGQLFLLEVLLRITTGLEMMLVVLGGMAGILLNPKLPAWGVVSLAAFALLNLLLASALKTVLARVLEKKGAREALTLLFVFAVMTPQLLAFRGVPGWLESAVDRVPDVMASMPWGSAGLLAVGDSSWRLWISLTGWLAAMWWFARTQFQATLRLDAQSSREKPAEELARENRRRGWLEWFYEMPSRLFRDPLGGLIEKELRFLTRSARFRLILLMSCTFGQLIWIPQIYGRSPGHGIVSGNYLTLASLYSLLLLGDVLFWNVFGFERLAVQAWFIMPVRLSKVLAAKNMVAVFFVYLVQAVIATAGSLLRLPFGWTQVGEAAGVTGVYILFLMAFGNLTSVYYPRAVNPGQAMRNASQAKTQLLLILVYPVVALPLMLAYGARYAFASEWAFFAALAVDLLIGAGFYWVALESAAKAAEVRKERILTALGEGEGPIAMA
jgi:ABC-2 type transport system permease protein